MKVSVSVLKEYDRLISAVKKLMNQTLTFCMLMLWMESL